MTHTPSAQAGFGRFWRRAVTALGLLLLALFFTAGSASSHPHPIPTIHITGVQRGQSVSFQTYNYPAGQTFTVRMGKMGTRGVGGEIVGYLDSGAGGSFPASFTIPPALKDEYQIAIRLDSNLGFYSFNWFYNNTTGTVGVPDDGPHYVGIPTFKITAVTEGENVTIETNNFPANMTFYVTMGKMFTQGIGGIDVGKLESGEGGTMTAVFNIPDALKDDGRISIRAQTAHAYPFYAYNWFWNNSTNEPESTTEETPTTTTTTTTVAQPIYYGIPTFTVCQVTRDNQVEILTKNYPLQPKLHRYHGADVHAGHWRHGGWHACIWRPKQRTVHLPHSSPFGRVLPHLNPRPNCPLASIFLIQLVLQQQHHDGSLSVSIWNKTYDFSKKSYVCSVTQTLETAVSGVSFFYSHHHLLH